MPRTDERKELLPRVPDDLKVKKLPPDFAEALRGVCTRLGLPAYCLPACRARKRCQTKDVVCWQTARDRIKPLVRKALAKKWQQDVANGAPPDVRPVDVDQYIRILERIERRKAKRHRSRKGRGGPTVTIEMPAGQPELKLPRVTRV